MKKIMITGVNGFVGSHLAEYLLYNKSEVSEVIGVIRNHRSDLGNIDDVLSRDVNLKLVACELTDAHDVIKMIAEFKPSHIYHLAAQSFVRASWDSPVETLVNNIVSQTNIFEAVRRTQRLDGSYDPKILIAGSSEEYGKPEFNPITEEHPLNALSPYAVSKIAQDKLAYQYVQSYGMKIVVARAFNHEGPRRGDVFVTSSFCKQIAEAKDGGTIKVGNLEAKRDFTHVYDMVDAYYLAMNSDKIKYGEPYNICTGKSITMQELLDTIIEESGKKITPVVDPERLRPSDIPVLEGDYSKFKEATGWEPKLTIKDIIKDLYKYHVDKLKKKE